ncbi:endonuclease III domain-containing protein [Leadbettera azotonutricia]|uniref:Endonuclease III (DNA-(Apurinic or apyrimidinic site)lyase) n=1 Tax=Leadbettera azotonutricia (strain ATCC BAA-888 / DSM 13862 / ZAS-9) TaxID=545695 RepID=F5Y9T6_LEAAZ|nr:endonuclease III [Leadbettera azotonutricia]AEF82183.1 endonuclease III (DNA-(apurinic or apyrimidinic site)lyase) [Leadbettera azotonutricia ZAS-9]
MKPEWGAVFRILEKWRREHLAASEGSDPSVTALAEEYKKEPGTPRTVLSDREELKERGSPPDKAWAVLVSTILSLRTKDAVTLKTSKSLLEKAPGPKELIGLGEEKTAKLAYPAGFYRTKAANLQKIAVILLTQYGGKVPADMDALLSLPGVGRKTANLVLTEAFDMDGICVDIHVHRISNRMGWVETEVPDKTEAELREILPKRYWKRINALLVLYGQNVCRPVSPFCSRCPLAKHCKRRGVGKAR